MSDMSMTVVSRSAQDDPPGSDAKPGRERRMTVEDIRTLNTVRLRRQGARDGLQRPFDSRRWSGWTQTGQAYDRL